MIAALAGPAELLSLIVFEAGTLEVEALPVQDEKRERAPLDLIEEERNAVSQEKAEPAAQ
ncbi:MAG: hypothetical protein L0191_10100 [Acidobacteria bacterium]|nr:hypothetical protein [Acidobacteriota bacterium]